MIKSDFNQPRGSTLGLYTPSLTLKKRLETLPNILDFDSDSQNDDSSRFRKAIAAGVKSLYVPEPQFFGSNKPLKIANVDIGTNIHIYGNGSAGYRQVGGAITILEGASYGFKLAGVDSQTRNIGGRIDGLSFQGELPTTVADAIRCQSASSFALVNLSFRNLSGSALDLRDFMESHIEHCYFNSVGSDTKNPINIGDFIGSAPWNVNNLHIENNTFGSCSGNIINISDSANADLIWILNNKFEWDSTPVSPNVSNKAVIYIGRAERVNVSGNGFVYYYPAHNKYDALIRVSDKSAYGNLFSDNTAWGCTPTSGSDLTPAFYWDIAGGSSGGSNNKANTNLPTRCTSIHSQDIDEPLVRTTPGNRPNLQSIGAMSPGYLSAHSLGGANASNFFVPDTGATKYGTVLEAQTGGEVRRLFIPKDIVSQRACVRVQARVMPSPTADALVGLNCDGSIVSTTIQGASQDYHTVAAGGGWQIVEWLIPASSYTAGQLIFTNRSDTVKFKLDGVRVSRADFVDVTIAWSPTPISAGSVVNTTASITRVSSHVVGTSGLKTDGTLGGAVSSSYFNRGANTLVVQLAALTAATPSITQVTVRLFLN